MRLRPLALIAALVGLVPAAFAAEVTGHVTILHQGINGVSGVEVDETGTELLAVTDGGWFLTATLERTDGELDGIELRSLTPLRGFDGLPAAARRIDDWSDAEGLARGSDGALYIAFERYMSVARYATPDATRGFIGNLPNFRDYDENRQVEAVAIHPDGRLFAFPERPGRWRRFIVFVHVGGRKWTTIPGPLEHRAFSIVGADFDEDGTLYLLDRKFRPGFGWKNRVWRIDDLDFTGARLVWSGAWNQFYNLEGLAVWRAPDGVRLLLVGDNNGRRVPTDIVEISLTE